MFFDFISVFRVINAATRHENQRNLRTLRTKSSGAHLPLLVELGIAVWGQVFLSFVLSLNMFLWCTSEPGSL